MAFSEAAKVPPFSCFCQRISPRATASDPLPTALLYRMKRISSSTSPFSPIRSTGFFMFSMLQTRKVITTVITRIPNTPSAPGIVLSSVGEPVTKGFTTGAAGFFFVVVMRPAPLCLF